MSFEGDGGHVNLTKILHHFGRSPARHVPDARWTQSAPAAEPFPEDLVDPRVMDQIGHLELQSRCVVDGFLSGKHRSTHKGGCGEFAQHRPYASGDEI